MVDIILACLDQIGPARASLWTWCIAEYEVECFTRLLIDSRLTSALLVIDSGARGKNRELLKSWHRQHGPRSIRWVVNHAKVATLESADYKLLIRGSMNLNYNPRFEQFDIDDGHPGFDIVRRIEEELPVLEFDHTNTDARNASSINKAFSNERLAPFAVKRTWAK